MNTSRYSNGKSPITMKASQPFKDVVQDLRDDLRVNFEDVSMLDVMGALGQILRGDFSELREEIKDMFEQDPGFGGWRRIRPNGKAEPNGHKKHIV